MGPLALAALVCALALASGCIVVPVLPRTVPYYDCKYVVLDEEGEPVRQTGLLLLRSHDIAACFPVEDGLVSVPQRLALAYTDIFGSSPMGLPVLYYGQFLNYIDTQIYAIVPGYVPRHLGQPGNVSWTKLAAPVVERTAPSRKGIELTAAEPEREQEYLRRIVGHLTPRKPEPLPETQRNKSAWRPRWKEPYEPWAKGEEDRAAIEKGRQYALDRLKALDEERVSAAARLFKGPGDANPAALKPTTGP